MITTPPVVAPACTKKAQPRPVHGSFLALMRTGTKTPGFSLFISFSKGVVW